ncbi:hypothetical protein WICPIJ_006862 [Wickerhamomyces pijperi]|uniref:Uncharacterized protein n=1 Tax=Wickerhamomyces pijperi TaxID=599730 RepID=A0A9P8Q2R1_WICPI|nr:hypothetical protein WICPIJ_006862 [Wickerhamomyces pijperi]
MTVQKQPLKLRIKAALFDVDGTIINSQGAITAFWFDFAKDKPYMNGQEVMDATHGWRTFDAIAKFAPDFAKEEYVLQLEEEIPDKFGDKVKEIPGSIKLVNSILDLSRVGGADKEKLAVVTSGTWGMAHKWFDILGLQRPKSFITAESVQNGKPHPEPYLLGRSTLGYEATPNSKDTVVVFEDAPAGIKAGKAADCFVIGIASTFDKDTVQSFGPDVVVPDLRGVEVSGYDAAEDEFTLTINEYSYVSERLLAATV